jgi:tRNA pseudouridine55 synthase
VTCTKGTYIRTLAEDIGKKLGCGAHLIGLRRTATADYKINQTITLEQLEAMTLEQREAALMPEDSAVSHLPSIVLDDDSVFYLLQGQGVWKSGALPKGLLRLYSERQEFLGLGELASDGKIAPKRLIRQIEN